MGRPSAGSARICRPSSRCAAEAPPLRIARGPLAGPLSGVVRRNAGGDGQVPLDVAADDIFRAGSAYPAEAAGARHPMGGVLFIDEAYYLYRPDNERDYGQEAIEVLLQVMENMRDDLAVVMAGYADRMGRSFAADPGFRSRIAHHVGFPD